MNDKTQTIIKACPSPWRNTSENCAQPNTKNRQFGAGLPTVTVELEPGHQLVIGTTPPNCSSGVCCNDVSDDESLHRYLLIRHHCNQMETVMRFCAFPS